MHERTFCPQILIAFVHDAKRRIGLERVCPLLNERQCPLAYFLVCILVMSCAMSDQRGGLSSGGNVLCP